MLCPGEAGQRVHGEHEAARETMHRITEYFAYNCL
jgi:hypothetical protein